MRHCSPILTIVILAIMTTLVGAVDNWSPPWLFPSCDSQNCTEGNCAPPPLDKNTPVNSVVRINNTYGKSTDCGSGVLYRCKSFTLVLTCHHLFSDGLGKIIIIQRSGKISTATFLDSDETWDLAILSVSSLSSDPSLPTAKLATRLPIIGETISILGYPRNTTLHYNVGKVQEFKPHIKDPRNYWFQVSTRLESGYSGGPMFNSDNELIGIIWGTAENHCTGTHTTRLTKFIKETTDKIAVAEATIPLENLRVPNPLPLVPVVDNNTTPQTKEPPKQNPLTSPLPTTKPQHAIVPPSGPSSNRKEKGPVSKPDPGPNLGETSSMDTQIADWLVTAATLGLQGLGWSTPPSAAILLIAKLALRRRRERKKENSETNPASFLPEKPSEHLLSEPAHNISYRPQPVDQGLLRMRQAMQLVSDEYPASMPWIKRFEDIYTLILSGELK